MEQLDDGTLYRRVQFSRSVVSDSLQLPGFSTPGSLSSTISWSLLKLMSVESVMPSSHLILCRPLLFLPSVLLGLWFGFFFSQWKESESKVPQSCPTLCDPCTVAYQAPLSMGFSRQEYWSGLLFLLQGIFLTQGSNPGLPHCRQIL